MLQADICDAIPGWAQINGRNFYLSSEEENLRWDVAEARAIEHPGGRLFEVRSSADNAVFEAVKNCYRGRIWIGGNDLAQTGNWVWASNGYEIDGYENFDNSEAKTGDCLDVRLEANFAWLKSACDGSGISHAFIVETGCYFKPKENYFHLLKSIPFNECSFYS